MSFSFKYESPSSSWYTSFESTSLPFFIHLKCRGREPEMVLQIILTLPPIGVIGMDSGAISGRTNGHRLELAYKNWNGYSDRLYLQLRHRRRPKEESDWKQTRPKAETICHPMWPSSCLWSDWLGLVDDCCSLSPDSERISFRTMCAKLNSNPTSTNTVNGDDDSFPDRRLHFIRCHALVFAWVRLFDRWYGQSGLTWDWFDRRVRFKSQKVSGRSRSNDSVPRDSRLWLSTGFTFDSDLTSYDSLNVHGSWDEPHRLWFRRIWLSLVLLSIDSGLE